MQLTRHLAYGQLPSTAREVQRTCLRRLRRGRELCHLTNAAHARKGTFFISSSSTANVPARFVLVATSARVQRMNAYDFTMTVPLTASRPSMVVIASLTLSRIPSDTTLDVAPILSANCTELVQSCIHVDEHGSS